MQSFVSIDLVDLRERLGDRRRNQPNQFFFVIGSPPISATVVSIDLFDLFREFQKRKKLGDRRKVSFRMPAESRHWDLCSHRVVD
jgi:hypothetical protein